MESYATQEISKKKSLTQPSNSSIYFFTLTRAIICLGVLKGFLPQEIKSSTIFIMLFMLFTQMLSEYLGKQWHCVWCRKSQWFCDTVLFGGLMINLSDTVLWPELSAAIRNFQKSCFVAGVRSYFRIKHKHCLKNF